MKIKKCPFCATVPTIKNIKDNWCALFDNRKFYVIECNNANCTFDSISGIVPQIKLKYAINAWNDLMKRQHANDQAVAKILELYK